MAITVNSPACKTFGFIKNAVSANASGGETIIVSPGAGKHFEIQRVSISSDSAISVTLGENLNAGAVVTALLGPVTFAAGQSITWKFTPSMLTSDDVALCVDASGAGNINVYVQGETR